MGFRDIISWAAIGMLSISYWFQIYKIHKRQEVMDLSIMYHVLLALGFGVLTWTAWVENSVIFMTKQILTTIPVVVIICQILYFRKKREEEARLPCANCDYIPEQEWNFCALCGLESSGRSFIRRPKGEFYKAHQVVDKAQSHSKVS
ncbi:MAG: PQ-loop repeat-containing protein [Oligoflexales bacterium]